MSVSAQGIHKTFGTFTALAGVDFSVRSGKLVALLGPSGSGKTTLLRIIAGLDSADPGSGRIHLHGRDVTEVPSGRRGVGFVFQHYALFRSLTVAENIAFGLRVLGRRERPSKSDIAGRVAKLLELVQLQGFGNRRPHELSGGERQRVALARALATEPKVLLLDEPFGALDARVRKELRSWLRRLHDRIEVTTVFVTHDQEEALEIADEVVIMNNARIEQVGTPQQVYDRPASPFVCEFLGNTNILRARTLAQADANAPTEAMLEADGSVYVRPHDIEVSHPVPGSSGVPAVLRSMHTAGPTARLTFGQVQTGETIEVEAAREVVDDLGLKVGDLATLRLLRSVSFDDDYSI